MREILRRVWYALHHCQHDDELAEEIARVSGP